MSENKEGTRITLKPPCEFAVRYILPAIRFMIAKTLIEKYGFSQSAVAEILGVTQPAVSYYVRSRRGQIWAKKLVRYREVREKRAGGQSCADFCSFEQFLAFLDRFVQS